MNKFQIIGKKYKYCMYVQTFLHAIISRKFSCFMQIIFFIRKKALSAKGESLEIVPSINICTSEHTQEYSVYHISSLHISPSLNHKDPIQDLSAHMCRHKLQRLSGVYIRYVRYAFYQFIFRKKSQSVIIFAIVIHVYF